MIKDGNLDWFYQGTEYVHANLTMKKYLKQFPLARLVIVNRAFHDVYGTDKDAPPTEVAYWNAKFDMTNQLYKEVVNMENKKLNDPNNKIVRRAMILFAYKKMMGRIPSKDDMAFWEPKIENYKKIVASGREWMYSPNGAQELAATVERALTRKLGKKPTAGQINEAIIKYTKTNAIFDEMQ